MPDLTVKESADLLGVSRSRFDVLVLQGRIKPVRESPKMFSRDDVDKLKATMQKPGRPRKNQ